MGYLNAAAQTLLGVGPNQALGRNITELTRGAETLLPLFDRARQGGEGSGTARTGVAGPGRSRSNSRLRRDSNHARTGPIPAAAGNRGHHAASAPDSRERAAGPVGREPLDGPPARARNQKPSRRLARRCATARTGTPGSGAARVHARHHQRSGSPHQSARFHARARAAAREAADQRARAAWSASITCCAAKRPKASPSIATTIPVCRRSRWTRTTSFRPC